jgi:glycosyltransferase involved in cell wall biosynthesis
MSIPGAGVPRLSVGLPVYNGERYLEQALDSLVGQTYENFELIISDNASTDGTATICRRYEKRDSRIRYFRQPRNIGMAPNHNFVFQQARGELFKWAASDDLYGRDLLQRCTAALDEHPEAVLAHSWTVAIDSTGNVTQSFEYPLATDSPSAPDRFRSVLFGGSGVFESAAGNGRMTRVPSYGILRACDEYGVIRASVMRRIAPLGSYHHSDRIVVLELALHGPFHMTPEWLYFRRDHPDRAYKSGGVRARCEILDPCRANRLLHPTARLLAEYMWGYAAAIRRAPLSPEARRQCYRYLAQWITDRAAARLAHPGQGRAEVQPAPVPGRHPVSVREAVAGQQDVPL